MPDRDGVPNQIELMMPTLNAIRSLGGIARISKITDQVIQDMSLSSGITEIPQGNGSQTRLEYNSGWTRTRLKNEGLIVNPDRGTWKITPEGVNVDDIEASGFVRYYPPIIQPEREGESG